MGEVTTPDQSIPLSAEVVRAIEWDCARLIHLYAHLNDAGRWAEVAALFAEGGQMMRPTAPDSPIEGRQAIFAALEGRPSRRARHVCANILIDVDGATAARGSSTMLLFSDAASPPLVGGFEDRFTLTPSGWRFAERRGTMAFGDTGSSA